MVNVHLLVIDGTCCYAYRVLSPLDGAYLVSRFTLDFYIPRLTLKGVSKNESKIYGEIFARMIDSIGYTVHR